MPGFAGALSTYGLWLPVGIAAMLALFFLLRGRVRIAKGWGGFDLVRFTLIERAVHWALALSYLTLAAIALLANLEGQVPPLPRIGSQNLSELLRTGGEVHRAAVVTFTAALLASFLLWLRPSLPHWRDAVWLLKGGGLLGWLAPAWKFNAGQKLYFWITMLAGAVLSVTGLDLAFPSQTGLFASMLAMLQSAGLPLPTSLTSAAEAQLAAAWHGAAALLLACASIVHVYLRTVGIQGAAAAMLSGRVDANWARQHHALWAEREIAHLEAEQDRRQDGDPAPKQ
jgi:formate dehydrogenase subunit gamma